MSATQDRNSPRKRKSTFTRTAAVLKMQKLKAALANGPLTVYEVADVLCLSHEGARNYINALKRKGEIYIRHWKSAAAPGKRTFLRAYYALGSKPDAPRPEGSHAVYSRRYVERLQKDPDAYEERLKRKRQWHERNSFKPRPDVAAEWLFRKAA